MKLLTIIGARPQFIKAATVSRVLRDMQGINEVLVHTGQHYDYGMSEVFFHELDIPAPGYNLGIGSAHHGQQTGRMLEAIEGVLLDERPDWVLVYGDTNSTLAGALAAAKLRIPVAHVEAGLRSFNRAMPEEINRVLTDHVADLLFAPTANAVQQLAMEGIDGGKTRLVGDVMYDAALFYAGIAKRNSRVLDRMKLKPDGYFLATVHRAENTDDPERLAAVFDGLSALAERRTLVLPLHPRTRRALSDSGLLDVVMQNLTVIEPVGYLDMVMLEKNAHAIITDSGGVQKEAFFYRNPCITLRDETEWTELVEFGYNRLVGADRQALIDAAGRLYGRDLDWDRPLYGTGKSAEEIVRVLQNT